MFWHFLLAGYTQAKSTNSSSLLAEVASARGILYSSAMKMGISSYKSVKVSLYHSKLFHKKWRYLQSTPIETMRKSSQNPKRRGYTETETTQPLQEDSPWEGFHFSSVNALAQGHLGEKMTASLMFWFLKSKGSPYAQLTGLCRRLLTSTVPSENVDDYSGLISC